MQQATPTNPRAIARGRVREAWRTSGASGVTNSQPTNMNIAMPTSDSRVGRSSPTIEAPNQPCNSTAGRRNRPATAKIIRVLHMPKVRITSARPTAVIPSAFSRPKQSTMPTPTSQAPPPGSVRVFSDSKLTSAMVPLSMVSAVPANTWTIR